MAVSVNYTFQLNRNALIRRAFQLAGVLSATDVPLDDDVAMASDFLNLELDSLQAMGVILRSVSTSSLTLVGGTSTYTLPATVLDVLPNATVKATSTTTTETPVTSIGHDRYLMLTDKTTAGTPTLMYLERGSSFTVKLWPVPSVAGYLQYKTVAFLRDSDSAAVDTDLGRHWHEAIMYALAAMIAMQRNQPSNKIEALQKRGDFLKQRSLNHEQEHGQIQFRPAPGYGYRRSR